MNLFESNYMSNLLRDFAARRLNIGDHVQGNSPKFWWNRGGGHCFQQKTCIISEMGQDKTKVIRPRLLLMTNRKLNMCFGLVLKSTTSDDLKGH